MSYPVDQNALHQMHHQGQPDAHQQPGMQAYTYQQRPGTQWVDGPGDAAAQQPVEQDMVFQWVDTPSYGRPAQQQHYMQQPPAPSQLLDPHFASGGMDPNYPGLAYGMPGPGMGLDQSGQYGQRRDLQYGAGPFPFFDQPGQRRSAPARAMGTTRAGRQADDKGRSRQAPAGNRQANEGGGGGGRRSAEPSADAQAAALIESMGTEGLRQTLVSILESLYEDRIKPMANYIKGRLKERSIPEPIVKSFVDLYSQHPDLFIVQQPTPGTQTDEATIFFVKEPSWFKGWVDIDAPDDPYDEGIWEELAKFLDGEHTFAGGRYGMARELMQRKLSFLEPLSLGEVCHMVQLAIQHRRLIVYHRKMLKPIQSVLCQLSPANGNGANAEGEEIKDMDDLCVVLFRMLAHHPQGIRLCRMKQMIKHELSRKLSEMAFQCTKLIELFNQEPLAATFVLDTENDGKSIYVRMGDPDKFSDHMKQLYAMASSTEMNQA